MRHTRLALMAAGGVLLLCALAVVVTLADYTSPHTVSVAHVPPVVGSPHPDTTLRTPSPVPTMPAGIDPTPQPTQAPDHGRGQDKQPPPDDGG